MHFDPEEFGRAMGEAIKNAVAPLHKKIADLESELAKIPVPQNGKDGTDGEPGRDGKDCDMEAVKTMLQDMVKAIPAPKDGKNGADGKDGNTITLQDIKPLIDEAVKSIRDESLQVVDAAVKAISAPKDGRDGKDGSDGKAGAPGERGEKGLDGKDGAGIADLMIDRAGELVATFTDGRMKNMGSVIGKDGKDGKDGADFSNVTLDWDGERTLVIRGAGGELRKTLPIPLDRGYWREGMPCEKGDVVTHDGNAWIALTETKTKPSHDAKTEWRMMARRGRDGERGPKGDPAQLDAPVKLGKKE